MEQVHCEKGQGTFRLKEHLQCAHVSHPNDAIAKEANDMELIDTDNEEDFEEKESSEKRKHHERDDKMTMIEA